MQLIASEADIRELMELFLTENFLMKVMAAQEVLRTAQSSPSLL